VASGVVYEGVFGALLTGPSGASVVLKFAKVKDPIAPTVARTTLAEKPIPVLTIGAGDLVQLYAKDVRLAAEDLSGVDRSDVGGFETDAAISRGRGGAVRELQRWQPDAGDDSTGFSLESSGAGPGWDQFAVNRERFGVQTTWSEHFYTTKIKRDECRISDAEAERIA
ncbi:PAB1-binding protein 1, partial [Tetrabaena socialis]